MNDPIKRIDKSFNHLMQSNSTLFSYKSKIYRYGGYGFWSARDFITYFDFDILEWEVINPEHSKSFPKGTFGGLHQLINDEIYFFNGQSVTPNNRVKHYFNDEVWKYNFTSKKWKYIGKIKPIDYGIVNKNMFGKDYLVVFETPITTKIDIVKNKITHYKRGKYTYNFNYDLPVFYYNDRIYFFNGIGDRLYLKSIPENEFFGEKISEEPFYKIIIP